MKIPPYQNPIRLTGFLRLSDLDGYGHFMIGNNMTSEEFPELVAVLMSNR